MDIEQKYIEEAQEKLLKGDSVRAEHLALLVLAVSPDNALAELILGTALLLQQRYEEAVQMLESSLAREQRWSGCLSLANCYLKLSRPEDALQAARRGLAISPDEITLQAAVAGALHGLRRFAEAVEAADIVLRMKSDWSALGYKGAALEKMGRFEEAVDCFRRAAAEKPGQNLFALVDFSIETFGELSAAPPISIAPPAYVIEPAETAGAGFTVLACCDASYLYRYGGSFVGSFAVIGEPNASLHLHVINPDGACLARLKTLAKKVPKVRLSVSTESSPAEVNASPTAGSTYFACNRFLQLPAFLGHLRNSIMVVDIDYVFESRVADVVRVASECDLAYMPREIPSAPWADYLAGLVVARPTPLTLEYFNLVGQFILRAMRRGEASWMLDQLALYCVHRMMQRFGKEPKMCAIDADQRSCLWHIGHSYQSRHKDPRVQRHKQAF